MAAAIENASDRSERSALVVLIKQAGFAQIELPLDSAARLVLELSIPKELVDMLSLGGNQKKLYLIVKLG